MSILSSRHKICIKYIGFILMLPTVSKSCPKGRVPFSSEKKEQYKTRLDGVMS